MNYTCLYVMLITSFVNLKRFNEIRILKLQADGSAMTYMMFERKQFSQIFSIKICMIWLC